MNFSEQPPSQQWAVLTCRGEKIAEVWFKPEGEPFGLTFRVLQESFQIPGMGQRLTTENLLRAVAIAPEEVESWASEASLMPAGTAPTPNCAIPSRRPQPTFPKGLPPKKSCHDPLRRRLDAPHKTLPPCSSAELDSYSAL